MEATKIQWATHTFNPWEGCAKVSPGCTNCYAAERAHRLKTSTWGPSGTRVVRSESYWREPLKWNALAGWCGNPVCKTKGWVKHIKPGECACGLAVARPRVFCASVADVFENWPGLMLAADGDPLHVCNVCGAWRTMEKICHGPIAHYALTMDDVRARLFKLIDATPGLDWLLVTKRPENISHFTPARDLGPRNESVAEGDGHYQGGADWPFWRDNVWHLASVEDQETADRRIPELLKVRSACLGLSMEPLLGPVRFRDVPGLNKLPGVHTAEGRAPTGLGWAIVGGESGRNARPCAVENIRDVVRQCRDAGMPVFVKQLGAVPTLDVEQAAADGRRMSVTVVAQNGRVTLKLIDAKGGVPNEWPDELRVRESPTPLNFHRVPVGA